MVIGRKIEDHQVTEEDKQQITEEVEQSFVVPL